VIIGGDMPVMASISRSTHPASRNFSTLDARSPWKVNSSFLILPAGVLFMKRVHAALKLSGGHCQSKFVCFAKTSEPDFAAIDFLAFFWVDLSGSMAAPSI
jgi:hypothetical protein